MNFVTRFLYFQKVVNFVTIGSREIHPPAPTQNLGPIEDYQPSRKATSNGPRLFDIPFEARHYLRCSQH